MNVRLAGLGLIGLVGVSCAARSAQLPVVEMHFSETPAGGAPQERLSEKFALNATLIANARLRYLKASELLKAAEVAEGGSPQKLMQAGRTLTAGDGVVFLATVRSNQVSGGSSANLIVYSVALGCARADLDAPGGLTGCKGYLLRVTRQWPSEIYELEEATVSLIPEGGTLHGRLSAKSVPAGFRADLDGEFAASIVQLEVPAAP